MATITLDKHLDLEKLLCESGYLPYEYVIPEKYIVTDIKCPICGSELGLYTYALSYTIECTTDRCLVRTVRGI